MAKKSSVVKNIRRKKLVDRYRSKRVKFKSIIKDPKTSLEEKREAFIGLEKLPRDSNPIRVRNRCNLTGRPRGYYRKFGLSRIALRELANNGKRVIIAGLDKDYLAKPFGPVSSLLSHAEFITKLNAICVTCGDRAFFTKRISKENNQVIIGEKDKYQARCRNCFDKK